MKSLGRNKKPREGISTTVLIIPSGVVLGREEYVGAYITGNRKVFCIEKVLRQLVSVCWGITAT